MSAYYVIGSDKELKHLNHLHVGFDKISQTDLKKYVKNVEFCKKFYYVSDPLSWKMLYDTKGDIDIYDYSNQETDLYNFIKYLRYENNNVFDIEFYKFWSIFNGNQEDDINEIYENQEINVLQHEDNAIDFDFNIKYIFIA